MGLIRGQSQTAVGGRQGGADIGGGIVGKPLGIGLPLAVNIPAGKNDIVGIAGILALGIGTYKKVIAFQFQLMVLYQQIIQGVAVGALVDAASGADTVVIGSFQVIGKPVTQTDIHFGAARRIIIIKIFFLIAGTSDTDRAQGTRGQPGQIIQVQGGSHFIPIDIHAVKIRGVGRFTFFILKIVGHPVCCLKMGQGDFIGETIVGLGIS